MSIGTLISSYCGSDPFHQRPGEPSPGGCCSLGREKRTRPSTRWGQAHAGVKRPCGREPLVGRFPNRTAFMGDIIPVETLQRTFTTEAT